MNQSEYIKGNSQTSTSDRVVYVSSRLAVKTLLKLQILHSCGDHGTAEIVGITNAKYQDLLNESYAGEYIEILVSEESTPIFCGLIENVSLCKGTDYTEVSIYAASFTSFMDYTKKNGSYQNLLLNYSGLFENISARNNGNYISGFEDKHLPYPIIQYEETDWMFAKRLASHLGLPLVASISSDKPNFYVGLCAGDYIGDMSGQEHILSISQNHMLLRADIASKRIFHTYSFMLDGIYNIGDYISFDGEQLYVLTCDFSWEAQRLICKYTFGSREAVAVKTFYSPRIKGISIEGTVLQTEDEAVRLHLQIDASQNQLTAFPYPWRPESGNVMYSMPEPGTAVSLKFPTDDEAAALAVHSIRSRSIRPAEIMNPKNRYYTTNSQKQMTFLPQSMDFINMLVGSRMGLSDDSGVSFQSEGALKIQAKGEVSINGNSTSVTAPKEIAVANSQSTVINLCNNVDTAGGTAKFGPTRRSSGRAFIPSFGKQYDVDDIEKDILSAVPVPDEPHVNTAAVMNII